MHGRIEFLRRALLGKSTRAEILAEIETTRSQQGITYVINNACNLSCRHCYLQVGKLTSKQLSLEESKAMLRSTLATAPDLICLSGKEVFLGNNGIDLLDWLITERDRISPGTRIGAITNGTLLHLHKERLLASGIDYLDISVDGVREDHDYNRGAGAYDRMLPNLRWVARQLGARAFVNMTLQQKNFRRLVPAIADLHLAGVHTVGFSFYHQLPYTDPALELIPEDYDSIFSSLHALAQIGLEREMTVLVEVDLLSLPGMLAFLRSDWFRSNDICMDKHGEFYSEHILSNGLRLQIRFSPFPLLVHKSIRITAEGDALAAEDTVNARLYPVRALGNIRNFDYDFSRLYKHACSSPRLAAIADRYFLDDLPLLRKAYREAVRGENLPRLRSEPVLHSTVS